MTGQVFGELAPGAGEHRVLDGGGLSEIVGRRHMPVAFVKYARQKLPAGCQRQLTQRGVQRGVPVAHIL
ncbi:hypothetical protein CVCC1112_1843 [Paenarthrobacter nicotinovorans]|nr:hypothetical protein CVCC1112_1843 [Paenarthrobacter nicotinovorans]